MKPSLKIFLTLLGLTPSLAASADTVGLLVNQSGADTGYTLFAPITATETYLIDNYGNQVHSWSSDYKPGLSVYLLENGNLLRTNNYQGTSTMDAGGSGGIVQELTWSGSLVWEFTYADATHRQHHDVGYLPDGNVLMVVWELKTYAEAVAAGRDTGLLSDNEIWPDSIIEVNPATGSIVWEWHVWDHLIQDYDASKPNYGTVADHPELIDLNYTRSGGADWTHINAVDYHAGFDQILLSVHEFSEIWVIDHSTTSAEAAGHSGGTYGKGGDLLYRWGNPQAYDAGTRQDQQLFSQHAAQWIEDGLSGAGNILIYNNGNMRNGPNGDSYSSVDEIIPPVDANGNYTLSDTGYDPTAPVWTYTAPTPTDFYSGSISGAQRLANDNTLICEGESGNFFEVTDAGEIVWQYVNPVTAGGVLSQGDTPAQNSVFRAVRYAADYAGLAGQSLASQGTIESGGTITNGSGAYLTNISTRTDVGSGADGAFAGFVISGSGSMQVMVRGMAVDSGVDPVLTLLKLNNGSWETVAVNDEWEDDSNAATVTALASNLHLTDRYGNDAGLLRDLEPGVYTAQLTSNGSVGSAVVGVDATDTASDNPRLTNISTRANLSSGNAAWAGFVISGNGSLEVMLRGIAVDSGVDPALTLLTYNGVNWETGANNDEWENDSNAAAVSALASNLQLPDTYGNDAGLLKTLAAGSVYTLQLSANGSDGAAVVGVDAVE